MLLRWLVNQYLQDGAQGKIRQVVGDFVRTATASDAQQNDDRPEPRTLNPEPSDFLPTDVAFIFALGIEAGGLVDSLKGVQTARQRHGIERAGKLAGREVVVVEAGLGAKAAARATAEAIKFYQPRWVVS